MILRALLLTSMTASMSGCAYVTSVPVDPNDTETRGLVHYEVMPVLVVAGGQANIKFLPDRSKKRVLQFGTFLAKHDLQVTYSDNGSLQLVKSNQDSTAAVSGLLDIANKIVEAKLPTTQTASGTVSGAGDVAIYAFVFGDDGELKGLRKLKDIPLGEVVAQSTILLPASKDLTTDNPDITDASGSS